MPTLMLAMPAAAAPEDGEWRQEFRQKAGDVMELSHIAKYYHTGSQRYREWIFLLPARRVGFLRMSKWCGMILV